VKNDRDMNDAVNSQPPAEAHRPGQDWRKRNEPEPLRRANVGARVIRGGAVRTLGYGLGMLLTSASSVLLLRHLGVVDFGRYMTVTSLVAIVGGITDVGLTTVGGRDLAVRPIGEERGRLLANLLGLRLVLTPLGVVGALLFAIAVGYDRTLLVGTAFAGLGLTLTAVQATMALPLTVELRIGRLTSVEVLKQAVMLVAIAALVVGSATLLPFFAVSLVVGAVALAVTLPLVGTANIRLPRFDRVEWRALIRDALPIAASLVMNVVYFRALIVLMSLMATAVATGFFATSFRVFELLAGIGSLVFPVALPLLSVAAENRERLQYVVQRMTEVAMIAGCYLVVLVLIIAQPVLDLLGGAVYGSAASVLRIQVFALIPVFVGQVCQVALISIRRPSAQAFANGIGLILVLALGFVLIPLYGAKGAAAAALVAEYGLALALIVLLARCDHLLRLSFRFLWKIAAAGCLSALVLAVPGLPPAAAAAAGTAIYIVALALTRAFPPEVKSAFMSRRLS
jgi:O-antigen/teichoic acid export membrane protein